MTGRLAEPAGEDPDPAAGPRQRRSGVLTVFPPMASPAPAGVGPGPETAGDCWDANREFFTRFLFDPGLLKSRLETVRRRRQAGDYRQAPFWAAKTAEEAALEAVRWQDTIDGAGHLLQSVLSPGVQPVQGLGRRMSTLHRLLAMVSTALFPTRIGWGWICCPTARGAIEATAFCRDRCVNPFLELAEALFAERVLKEGYSAVVFAVDSEAQCPAVLTLAEWCRTNAPGLRRELRAPAGVGAHLTDFFDKVHDAGPPSSAAAFFGPAKTGAAPAPVLARWRIGQKALFTLADDVKKAARDGIWNHVELHGLPLPDGPRAGLFEATHSWCRWEESGHAAGGGRQRWPETVSEYAGVSPLPGVPLWCAVGDPFLLIPLLGRMTPSELSRWRFDSATGEEFCLGDALDYRFLPPAALSAEEMDEVCNMVLAGGSVKARWVRHNLQRAFLIGVVHERGVIVANSSLKRPRPEYVEQVSRRAGIDLSGFLERGYTSVRPEYRGLGIGTRLLEGLTARAEGRRIFSIIGEDNPATQKIALRNRTRKVAVFFSRALQKDVGIWMPEDTAEEFEKESRKR